MSPVLICQELEAVQRADTKKLTNFELKVRRTAGEVLAVYSLEEMSMELLVRLPNNHPLDPVAVDSGRRVGVEERLWRKWLLQLFTFVTNQNGSILDGVMLWKKNLDKMFEGKEECMICFYILHGSTLELPEKQCKSCRKRYHNRCLVCHSSVSLSLSHSLMVCLRIAVQVVSDVAQHFVSDMSSTVLLIA